MFYFHLTLRREKPLSWLTPKWQCVVSNTSVLSFTRKKENMTPVFLQNFCQPTFSSGFIPNSLMLLHKKRSWFLYLREGVQWNAFRISAQIIHSAFQSVSSLLHLSVPSVQHSTGRRECCHFCELKAQSHTISHNSVIIVLWRSINKMVLEHNNALRLLTSWKEWQN